MHIFKHFATVVKHKHYVFIHACKAGIPWQGLWHDMSKFHPVEFFTSAKYFIGTGSPINVERKDKGYSKVWMHHSKRNKHHFEYWTDPAPTDNGPGPIKVKMPLKYVIEMYCDMLAANKVYKGESHTDSDPIAYFRKTEMAGKMHPESAALLEKLFLMLEDKGEKATFKYIRKLKKQKLY